MGIAYMNAGQHIEWNNVQFKLDRLIEGEWQLLNDKTNKASHLSVDDFHAKYATGEIRFFDPRPKFIPEFLTQSDGTRIAAHLDQYPEPEREGMKRKRYFLESYLKKFGDVRSQSVLRMGINDLWGQAWGKAPHAATVARWLKKYIQTGRDIRSLGSGDFRKGNAKGRYPVDVTEKCNEAIEKVFLKLERGSIDKTWEVAKTHVKAENSGRPEENKLPLPTKSYIKSLISRVSEFDKYARRFGRNAAEHKYRNSVHGTVCTRPLERVEIDHTRLDIVVVDEATGLPLERPWLTLVMDVYTRSILGFSLSFDPPSHMTVARALKMALKPKANLKERWPSLVGNWLMFGCMDVLVVDNGFEFHCDSLEAACLILGITISFCPRKKGWWKGHIERVLGTLNRAVTDGIPGRTFAGIKDKGDYDPVESAVIPLKTMEEMIAKWIVDIYHETTHSTLGAKPREAWENAISPEDIPMVTNADELDAVMGIIANRTLSHRGIEINWLRYNSEELGQVRQQFGDLKNVTVKWDPEDLGYIHVLPPNGKTICVPVVPRFADYAIGLTLYQHKQCKAYSKQFLEGRNDVEALSDAKAALQDLAEKGMRGTAKNKRIWNRLTKYTRQEKLDPASNSVEPSIPTPLMTQPAYTERKSFNAKVSDRHIRKEQSHEII